MEWSDMKVVFNSKAPKMACIASVHFPLTRTHFPAHLIIREAVPRREKKHELMDTEHRHCWKNKHIGSDNESEFPFV